jgi:hypothetical protein
MIASTNAEFEALVLDAGVSFDDFGNVRLGLSAYAEYT